MTAGVARARAGRGAAVVATLLVVCACASPAPSAGPVARVARSSSSLTVPAPSEPVARPSSIATTVDACLPPGGAVAVDLLDDALAAGWLRARGIGVGGTLTDDATTFDVAHGVARVVEPTGTVRCVLQVWRGPRPPPLPPRGALERVLALARGEGATEVLVEANEPADFGVTVDREGSWRAPDGLRLWFESPANGVSPTLVVHAAHTRDDHRLFTDVVATDDDPRRTFRAGWPAPGPDAFDARPADWLVDWWPRRVFSEGGHGVQHVAALGGRRFVARGGPIDVFDATGARVRGSGAYGQLDVLLVVDDEVWAIDGRADEVVVERYPHAAGGERPSKLEARLLGGPLVATRAGDGVVVLDEWGELVRFARLGGTWRAAQRARVDGGASCVAALGDAVVICTRNGLTLVEPTEKVAARGSLPALDATSAAGVADVVYVARRAGGVAIVERAGDALRVVGEALAPDQVVAELVAHDTTIVALTAAGVVALDATNARRPRASPLLPIAAPTSAAPDIDGTTWLIGAEDGVIRVRFDAPRR